MKAKKHFILILTGLIFMGLLASCKNKNISIEGNWETSHFELDGVVQEICVSELNIKKIKETTYQVNGNSGINSFFGTVISENGKFKASDQFGSTKMAGDPKAMAFEDNFMDVLLQADTVELKENENNAVQLILTSASKKGKIIFQKK